MIKYGLIGLTLGYSFSRGYFLEVFEKLGLVDHQFDNYELPRIEAVREMLALHPELKGFTVTIPYKEQIIPYLTDISDAAKEIGAVNVVVKKGEFLIGHNTDAIGFELSLKQLIPDMPMLAPAWILGTGGASKAITYVLRKLKQPYKLVSRTPKNAETLSYKELANQDWLSQRLIINTTPVGTFPDIDKSPPIPLHLLGSQHFIYDLIYNPKETLLLREGRNQGAQTINGLPMLELQADAAWEIWRAAAKTTTK